MFAGQRCNTFLVVVEFSLVGEIRPDGSKGLSACSLITLGLWRCFFIVCLMSKLIMVDDCSLGGLVGVNADFPSRSRKLVAARDWLGELACPKRAEADGCGGRGWMVQGAAVPSPHRNCFFSSISSNSVGAKCS
jgi:hypothetical protein